MPEKCFEITWPAQAFRPLSTPEYFINSYKAHYLSMYLLKEVLTPEKNTLKKTFVLYATQKCFETTWPAQS